MSDIQSVVLTTIDGHALHGDLAVPSGVVRVCAVVCHPHPLYGGDRHNIMVDALFRALPSSDVAALRFDFRGVGRSGGSHGAGVDEKFDVLAALDAFDVSFAADIPRVLCGYSFGAAVALGVPDPRVRAWVSVAAPLSMIDEGLSQDGRPRLLLVPEHDQYCDPSKAREATENWTATSLEVIPEADHFLGGRATWTAERAVAWLASLFPAP